MVQHLPPVYVITIWYGTALTYLINTLPSLVSEYALWCIKLIKK